MGLVCLVEHRELGRECVAKLVHERLTGEPQWLERIRIEAESLGSLNHPHIVSVNNFGTTEDGRPFIVMEYLRGRDLARALASGRSFTAAESVDLVLEACSALGAAHTIGIVHRDIKPENLFLHEEPDGTTVLKILDFGVARIMPGVSPDTPTPLPEPTETGVIVGTLRYASPEVLSGARADYRADIYSLGLVLYRLLARRGPFGEDLSDTGYITACLTEEPKAPSCYAPALIPKSLDEIVLKALRKSPDERFQTIKDLSDALIQVRPALAAAAHSPDAVPIALAGLRGQHDESLVPTAPARNAAQRQRSNRINGVLFGVVLLLTTIIVALLVTQLYNSSGGR
jgi:serine/threonine protein kinase